MRTATLTIEDRISLVEAWLLNSGIQSSEGGFYAWQDMEDKSHPYLYSEITGYSITTTCFLHELSRNNSFMTSAKRAARWISKEALDPTGGVLTRNYVNNSVEHYSFERGNIYSFDCAMVAFGMLKLYKQTSDRSYLECGGRIVNFLNERMLKPNGLYYPVFDTKKNVPYEDTDKWSTQSGSFHCKLALCLCELADIKGDPSYFVIAKRLIDASLENFYKNGRFVTGSSDDTSHLHPYSYTLEGILYYSYKTKDPGYKDVVQKAFNWMAGLQKHDGGFPTMVIEDGKESIAYQRCDIQSQVLRLSYFIRSDFDRGKLIDRFLELQNISDDYKGGFFFGTDEKGLFRKHSNAWCSMFALQALYLASGRLNNDIVMEYLV